MHLGVAALDPSTLTPRSAPRFCPEQARPSETTLRSSTRTAPSGWAVPTDEIRKLDPVSHDVLRTGRLGTPAGALAVRSRLDLGDERTRRAAHRSRHAESHTANPPGHAGLGPDRGRCIIGVGRAIRSPGRCGGSSRALPCKRTPSLPVSPRAGITFGDGALWVASAVDGKVFRIDAETEDVRSFELGNAPVDVSVAPAGVWAAVAAGGGRTIEAAPKLEGLETLPAGTCDTAVHGGSADPDFLIVSDLPMQLEAPVTLPMVQAIEFVLRQHGFRAGPYNVALQSCDDATVPAASYTEEKCAANAKRYAATLSVIAVIGPYNSGCASAEIPVANRARPGPLPIVSPTSSYVGLTRSAPGVSPGDPRRNYPTGVRNFARAYPPDDMQGAADAILAKRLGVRHPYVFLDDPNEGYGAIARARVRDRGQAARPGRDRARVASAPRRLRGACAAPATRGRRRRVRRRAEQRPDGPVHPGHAARPRPKGRHHRSGRLSPRRRASEVDRTGSNRDVRQRGGRHAAGRPAAPCRP